VLPVLVLAARPVAQITRIAFVSVRQVLGQDYVRTARSKGLRGARVLAVHVLRNAAIPVLTTVGVSLRFSLSSLPLVEFYFAWPGAGFTLLKGIAQRDDNLTVALVLSLALFFILVNLALDLLYRLIDPRLLRPSAHVTARERQSLAEALCSVGAALRDAIAHNPLAAWLKRARTPSPPRRPVPRRPRAPARRPLARSIARNVPLSLGTLLLVGLAAIVFAGPVLAPNNPSHTQGLISVDGQFLSPPFAPGDAYPWGTDALGRGLLSQILAGARQTLTLGLLAVAARAAVGVTLGAIAGWREGGYLDRAILSLSEVIAAFPTLLLAMALILALGIRRGMPSFVVAQCFVGWGEIMQYVRGQVIAIRPQTYIESAYAVGARPTRIVVRHVLPNFLSALVSIASLEMGAVLMLLGELGFISIFIGGGKVMARIPGVRVLYSDVPEWGALLSSARYLARTYPWTALYPMLAFAVSIVSFNLFGEGVRRLIQEGGLAMKRLLNRYTLGAAVVALVALRWLSANSGALPFYRQDARAFGGERAYAHLEALTAPKMEGRALGTAGLDRAAAYIAHNFAGFGLQAAGQKGTFFQERKRSFGQINAVPTLVIDDGGPELTYGVDYAVYSSPYMSAGEAHSPVRAVCLARPIDYQGATWRVTYPDLYGRRFEDEVILTLSDREADQMGRMVMDGLLVVVEDPARLARQASFGGRSWRIEHPRLLISEATAERILVSAGYALEDLRAVYGSLPAEGTFQLPIPARVHMRVDATLVERTVRHVLGYIPGTHSYDFCADCLGRQLIVVMAPYDRPPPGPGGAAPPAANDNASGVAVMLEAIRVIQETDYQPYKTLFFVAYSAEGLEGGEPVDQPDVKRFLQARPGMSAFELEAVVLLRGVGGGTGDRIEISAMGSLRLAELFESAARQMGARVVRADEGIDLGVIYRERGATASATEDAPAVRLSWEGWEARVGMLDDTIEGVSAARLEQVGRALSLALMVLGREVNY